MFPFAQIPFARARLSTKFSCKSGPYCNVLRLALSCLYKTSILCVHMFMYLLMNSFFLGIAFDGLKNKDLYPIVASTSAHSGMKLITSCMLPHSLQLLSSEIIFNKYANCNLDTHPKNLPLPPGLQKVIQDYMPFIKYVSVKAGNNRLEYIRRRNSKRRLEEESSETQENKKICTSSDFISSSSYWDEICIPRKRSHNYSCFKVLFDTKTGGSKSQNQSEHLPASNAVEGNKDRNEGSTNHKSSSSHCGESSSSRK